jgi:hypothetical protein
MSQDSNIRQPVAEACQDKRAEKLRDYDMDDSHDLQGWPKLAPVLQDCETTLGEAYRSADSISRNYHFRHKVAGIVAAFGGMFAVLFAIAQLPDKLPFGLSLEGGMAPGTAKGWEAVAAFAALVAVVVGLRVALSKKWLVEREKAERCRFVKFGFLISPEAWSDPSDVRQARLSRHVEDINTLDQQALQHLAEGEDKAFDATSVGTAAHIDEETIDRGTLRQLFDYYQEKRLCLQLRYFERQAKGRYLWDWLTRVLPLWLFFASIGAALLHFIYDVVFPTHQESYDAGKYDTATLLMLMLAACLPVIAAAIRLLRAAHEFGRNRLRFQATSNELKQLLDRLQKEADPKAKLEILHKTESALQAERREWLRLMIEAEWFG